MKHAKKYFDNHSTVNVLYFTSDGLAFFEEDNAKNHARSLEDRTVVAQTRQEVEDATMEINSEDWAEISDDYEME